MAGYFTESNYENAVLQLLNEELGYNYIYGPDVERDYHSPLYEDVLLPSLQRINKSLPMDALTEAIYMYVNSFTAYYDRYSACCFGDCLYECMESN